MAHIRVDCAVRQTGGRAGEHEPAERLDLEPLDLLRTGRAAHLAEILHGRQPHSASPCLQVCRKNRDPIDIDSRRVKLSQKPARPPRRAKRAWSRHGESRTSLSEPRGYFFLLRPGLPDHEPRQQDSTVSAFSPSHFVHPSSAITCLRPGHAVAGTSRGCSPVRAGRTSVPPHMLGPTAPPTTSVHPGCI
jgi:hypothetical protein